MKEIKHFFPIGMTWLHWYLLNAAPVKISLASIRTKKKEIKTYIKKYLHNMRTAAAHAYNL